MQTRYQLARHISGRWGILDTHTATILIAFSTREGAAAYLVANFS
jgi:hypothetical protein